MTKKHVALLAFIILADVLKLSAQDFDLPKNYSFKYTVDYATYQSDFLKCVDWLESSPLGMDHDKHTEAYKFVFDWINGAPNVHVYILGDFISSNKKNTGLLAVYMGEWSRYEIKNGDKANQKEAALAAIRAEIKVYKKGNGVAKDKTIEKLANMDAKGQLDKYVTEKLPKDTKNARVVTPAGH